MKPAKYFLETFGCQMNILDSQLIEAQLRARGMTPTPDPREADVVLFNTCSVRQHAEDKVYARLGHMRRIKNDRPDTVVGVVGCMAERAKDDLFVRAPHVDLICGPGELNTLPALIDEVVERHEQVAALAGSQSRRTRVLQRALQYDSLEALDLSRRPEIEGNPLQSYVRVQRGCDKFCAYCVVPFTRGPERSRPPEHIIREAALLAERGCREITLLGQTVNSYVHQEDGKPVSFARLLERVATVAGLDRVRFVTSFPADFDEDIFRVMRDYPKILPYLHLPAQSGSDRILQAMRRGYRVADYLRLIDRARRIVPGLSLAGDMIVGFCGETDADFSQSVELVRRAEYDGLFVFKYSPRPGTKADRVLPDDVPDDVKAARNHELLAVHNEIALRRKRALIGSDVEVLVEGPSKAARKAQGESNAQLRARGKASPTIPSRKRPTPIRHGPDGNTAEPGVRQLVGRTPGDLMAVFDAPAELIGAIVRVRVEDASPHTLLGRVTAVVSPARGPVSSQPGEPSGRSLPVL